MEAELRQLASQGSWLEKYVDVATLAAAPRDWIDLEFGTMAALREFQVLANVLVVAASGG